MNQPENNNQSQDNSEYSEEWLSAYIDDELTDAQRAVVEQRLASDSETQQLLNDLQRVRGLVNQLPAWSGKLISAADFIQESGAAIVSTDGTTSTTDNDFDHAGDYHDELKPTSEGISQNESQLRSESIAGTLEQDSDADVARLDAAADDAGGNGKTSLAGFTDSGQTRFGSWLRPLALAACLMMLLGGGVWVWNSGSSWTVATSTGGGRELQQEMRAADAVAMKSEANDGVEATISQQTRTATGDNLPDRLPSLLSADDSQPSSAGVQRPASPAPSEAQRDASDLAMLPSAKQAEDPQGASPASAPAAAFSANTMAKEKAPNAAVESTQEPLAANPKMMRALDAGQAVEGSLGKNLANNARDARNDRAREELDAERTGALGGGLGGSANDAPSTRPTFETESRGRAGQGKISTKVQLAHSAGWSARDIEAALERLAPLLNLPMTQTENPVIADSIAAIPIAIVTPKAPATGATPLGNRLQQQAFPLQEVVPADSKPLAWQAPFAQSVDDGSSTIALFILRDEAEQILQAAQQAGELATQPVWISSASGAPTPANPKQQVVLLFTPQ